MARITKAQLMAALETLLQSKRVCIYLKELDGDLDAYSTWTDTGPIVFTIDPYRIGVVRGTLHELLHVVLYESLKGLGNTIEEWTIQRVEEKLWLRMTKVDLARWRRYIAKKVEEC